MNKDLINLTFGDLLIKYKYDKDEKYLEEAKKRLSYCDFSDEVRDYIIKEESKLITENIDSLIDKVYISNDFKLDEVRKNIDKYTLTDILCIIDEAVTIKKLYVEDFKKELIDDLECVKEENFDNFLFLAFFERIEKYFRDCHNLKLVFKGYVSGDSANKLYSNEMDIIMKNRWGDMLKNEPHPYE